MNPDFDLLIIGGGINGCGIARDASGRGLSVCLTEMNDLGSATSSSSTKLFHGGLRYLEYFEFRLVREALIERENLLRAMPHIAWPMRFVLPYHKDMRFDSTTPTSKLLSWVMPWMKGQRPAWLIRLGLFLYDNLGGRQILPGTSKLDLQSCPEGLPLNPKFSKAFEYSDCWVQDSRLVVLNARDAEARGAKIMPRHKVTSATCRDGIWHVELLNTFTQTQHTVTAGMLVNAAGPWVADIIGQTLKTNQAGTIKLVRGSHIVTKKLFEHDKCYFFQGTDGRIIFAIPYENEFTLIGTTDQEHKNADTPPECTEEEQAYLLTFINQYLATKISSTDIVWSYSGVRPLYDDGEQNASATSRDYVTKVDESAGAPVLNIFGGKITTYRCLAESAMEHIAQKFPQASTTWTKGKALPGGDFPVDGVNALIKTLMNEFAFLDHAWATRLIRTYGTLAKDVLGQAKSLADLGQNFGSNLTEQEVLWLMKYEYAATGDDIAWRRTKLGLKMSNQELASLNTWVEQQRKASFV